MNNNPISKIILDEINRFKERSLKQRFCNLLYDNPNGIKIDDILKSLNIKLKQLYDLKHKINKDNKSKIAIISYIGSYKIDLKPNIETSHKTKLQSESPKEQKITIDSTPSPFSIPTKSNTASKQLKPSLLSKEYTEKLNNLHESDRADILDMLKKAYYYQKAAISLIDANDFINNINNND